LSKHSCGSNGGEAYERQRRSLSLTQVKAHFGFPVCSAVTATFLKDHKIISRRL
ncbi:unnamed protein product, partial [Gulo gulo]